jgi:transmembrane sensor
MALSEGDRALEALRSADERWSNALLPGDADRRIAIALEVRAIEKARAPRRAFALAASFAVGAVAASVVFWALYADRQQRPEASIAEDGVRVLADACRVSREGTKLDLSTGCRVGLGGVRVEAAKESRLERAPEGLRLLFGLASFEVDHVRPGEPPVRVLVSGGAIEVLGTRFVVFEGGGRGHVDLIEGRIRFVAASGEVTAIEPGRRHVWSSAPPVEARAPPAPAPLVASPPPPPPAQKRELRAAPSARESPPPPPAEPAEAASEGPEPSARPDPKELASGLERAGRLRALGRHREAISVLESLESRGWDDHRTREVISFEIGRILDDHSGDRTLACRRWLGHRSDFPGGRYASEVDQAIARLECE